MVSMDKKTISGWCSLKVSNRADKKYVHTLTHYNYNYNYCSLVIDSY